MPEVAVVEESEVRDWFKTQLARIGPNGRRITQTRLAEELDVHKSTIHRNRRSLLAGEDLSENFNEMIHDMLAAQQLDAKKEWHLRELHKTQAAEIARNMAERQALEDRIEAERKAREDLIKAERQAETARRNAERRAIAQRRAEVRAAWEQLEARRPDWWAAGRLPLLPTAEDVRWFDDALSLEIRMMRDEKMKLVRSLMGWGETWRDEIDDKRVILRLLTERADRRRLAIKAGKGALEIGKFFLGLSLLAAVLGFVILSVIVAIIVVVVIVRVAPYVTEASSEFAYTALTSTASVLILAILTAGLFALVPIPARGQRESALFPWILGGALVSLGFLVITGIAWFSAEILPNLT